MLYLMSAVELVRAKILFAHLKALEITMRKLDLSVHQIISEKNNKLFLSKKVGFIDVLSTVFTQQSMYEYL